MITCFSKKRIIISLIAILLGGYTTAQNPPNTNCGTILDFRGEQEIQTDINSSFFNGKSFTVEAWINIANQRNSLGLFIASTGDYDIYFGGENSLRTNKLVFRIYNASTSGETRVVSNSELALNKWYHIAISYEYAANHASVVKMYINGALDKTQNGVTNLNNFNSGANFKIGNSNFYSGDDYYFEGAIDELRIWDIAKSGTDIELQKNSSLTSPQTGLVASFNFNEGYGSDSIVDSIEDYKGILNNFNVHQDWRNIDFSIITDSIEVDGNTITSLSEGEGLSYNWFDCKDSGNELLGISKDFIATRNGDFQVKISAENCELISKCKRVSSLSMVADLTKGNLLKAHPNPFKNSLTLNIAGYSNIHEVQIISAIGKIIFSKQLNPSATLHLDLNIPSGTYFIVLRDVEGTILGKDKVIKH